MLISKNENYKLFFGWNRYMNNAQWIHRSTQTSNHLFKERQENWYICTEATNDSIKIDQMKHSNVSNNCDC